MLCNIKRYVPVIIIANNHSFTGIDKYIFIPFSTKLCLCDVFLFVFSPTALYSIHKKKVYGAKMLESQNLQTPKSK